MKTPLWSFPRDDDEHDGGQNEKEAHDRKSQSDRAWIGPNMQAWWEFQQQILYPVHPFGCARSRALQGSESSGAVLLRRAA